VDHVPVGQVTVTVPAAAGSGSGGGGHPGCPSVDAFVRSLRGVIRAGEVRVGDWLALTDGTWGQVTHSRRVEQPCVRVETDSGHVLTCSESAPLGTADGQVLASDVLGAMAHTDSGHCLVVRAER